VTVSESLMLENATVGLESRAYPDGRGAPGLEGHTIVMRSLVRGTMTGGWPASGEGIVARGGTLEVRESTIDGNEGAAVLLSDGAVAAISGSRVINNGGPPFCFGEGTAAAEAENDVAGNGRLTPVCGD